MELQFFDANCRIGRAMLPAPECAAGVAELTAELDRVGVARALVGYSGAAHGGAVFANTLLAELLKADADGRLTGVWTVLPEHCHELPEGEALLQAMRAHRIGAVDIQPVVHRWSLHRFAAGGLFGLLAAHRVPIIVRVDAVGGWDPVYALAEGFPDNIFIVANTGLWGCDRYIRPLLANCPNLYLETSEYWVAGGLSELAAFAGAARILFGSGYPVWNHAQQMLNLRHAEISWEDKKAIASGNLERLLSEVRL